MPMRTQGFLFLFKFLWVVVIISGAIGSVGLLVTKHRAAKLSGPVAGTQMPDNTFMMLAGSKIYHLDPTGRLLSNVSAVDARLGFELVDIEPINDNEVLVADPGRGNLQRCDNGFEQCQPVIHIKAGHISALSEPYQFDYDSATKWIYIIFPLMNELAVYGLDGHHLASFSDQGWYRPSDILLTRDGRILSADALHQRVMAYRLEPGFKLVPDGEWSTATDRTRPGHSHPIRLAQSERGDWWLLLANNALKSPDLVKFEPDFAPIGRVQLGLSTEPSGIVIGPDKILVTDAANYRILHVSNEGEVLDDFSGPAAFDIFAESANAQAKNLRDRLLVWCLIAISIMGFAICLYLIKSMRMVEQPDTILPDTRWIFPEQRYRQYLPRIFSIFFGLGVVGIVWLFLMFGVSNGTVFVLFGMVFVYVLPIILILYILQVSVHGRIGLSGDQVLVCNHLGKTTVGSMEQLRFDGSTIVLGKSAVTLKVAGLGAVYSPADMQGDLKRLYESAKHPGWWAMELTLLRLRHPPALITYFVTVPIGLFAMLLFLAK